VALAGNHHAGCLLGMGVDQAGAAEQERCTPVFEHDFSVCPRKPALDRRYPQLVARQLQPPCRSIKVPL